MCIRDRNIVTRVPSLLSLLQTFFVDSENNLTLLALTAHPPQPHAFHSGDATRHDVFRVFFHCDARAAPTNSFSACQTISGGCLSAPSLVLRPSTISLSLGPLALSLPPPRSHPRCSSSTIYQSFTVKPGCNFSTVADLHSSVCLHNGAK